MTSLFQIANTNMPSLLYHSTPFLGIQALVPLSHLGTYKAALETYGRKLVDVNLRAKTQNKAYLLNHEVLECSLRSDSNSIGPLEDWGSPHPLLLLRKISRSNPNIFNPDELQELNRELHEIEPELAENFAREKLLDLLRVNDIQYVSYKNNQEDRDSISICLIDPSIVTVERRLRFSNEQIHASVESSIYYTNTNQRDFADELLGLL